MKGGFDVGHCFEASWLRVMAVSKVTGSKSMDTTGNSLDAICWGQGGFIRGDGMHFFENASAVKSNLSSMQACCKVGKELSESSQSQGPSRDPGLPAKKEAGVVPTFQRNNFFSN